VPMAIEWDGGDAVPMRHRLIDIPVVEGGIGGDMGGQLVRGKDGVLEERAVIGDIRFVEGQGVLGQHHIAIDRISRGGHAGAIAPNVFFLCLFCFVGLLVLLWVLLRRLCALLWCGGRRFCLRGWRLGLAGLNRGVLIGTPFDAELAIGIAGEDLRFVVAVCDVDALVIFLDPGIDVLHIESTDFAQAGDLGL